jgi:hypothetical protein
MNYGELKSHFLALANRRDLTSNPTLAATFISQAITRAQRALRVPAMEASDIVTWDADGVTPDSELAIPSDLVELKDLTYEDEHTLRKADLNTVLRELQNGTGTPTIFARRGSNWLLAMTPPDDTTIRIDYYAEFDALSADTDTNFLTEIGFDAIIAGAMMFMCVYFKDKRADAYEAMFSSLLKEIQDMADRDEFTASAQVAPAYRFDEE